MLIWMTWVPCDSARFNSFISRVTLGFCTISTSGLSFTSAVKACCIAAGLLLGSRTTYFMPRQSASIFNTRFHSSCSGTPKAIGRKAMVLFFTLVSESARSPRAVLVPPSSWAMALSGKPISAAPTSARAAFDRNDSCDIVISSRLIGSSLALSCGLLVSRMQPVVEDDGGEQHHALDDVLHLTVDVHDGEGVEQRADQRAADDDAEHTAATADQTDASQHHHQDDVEDVGALHNAHLHAAGGADPDQAGQPGKQRHHDVLEHDQRTERDAGEPGGFGIVAL